VVYALAVEGAAALIDQKRFNWLIRDSCQEDFGDIYILGLTAAFAFFKDEAASICGGGSICWHPSRRRSQAFGLQIAPEQICRGGARLDLTIQHLQCWFKVRRPWTYRLGLCLNFQCSDETGEHLSGERFLLGKHPALDNE
jgi:hypothetical protein